MYAVFYVESTWSRQPRAPQRNITLLSPSISTAPHTNRDKTLLHAQDTPPAAYASSSRNSLAVTSDASRYQDELMDAMTAIPPNVVMVRSILSTVAVREDLRKPVLLSPNASTRHKLRTPLMAAASTGEMPIVGKRGPTQQLRWSQLK